MEVLIKEIQIGAQYQGKIYDYWITGQLQSGTNIKIFDYNYDLQDFAGEKVECLIFTPLASIIENQIDGFKENIVKGEIIRSYKINEKWHKIYEKEHNIYDIHKNYIAIKTKDGYFPSNLSEDDIKDIDDNKEILFNIGRYDLIAWHPIE